MTNILPQHLRCEKEGCTEAAPYRFQASDMPSVSGRYCPNHAEGLKLMTDKWHCGLVYGPHIQKLDSTGLTLRQVMGLLNITRKDGEVNGHATLIEFTFNGRSSNVSIPLTVYAKGAKELWIYLRENGYLK